MTEYKYQYVFPLTTPNGAVVERSSETVESLRKRANNIPDRELIEDFIEANRVGSFIKLDTGELVFQTS